MSNPGAAQLPLAPLGAGDLIDRAVRLYHRHLFTLMRIAAPPVIVSAIGLVFFSVAWRKVWTTPSGWLLALYFFLGVAGVTVIVSGYVLSLIVMGGAARNLVAHLLWNERVSVRATYSAVRSRFWALLGASLIMVTWFCLSVMVASFGAYMVLVLVGTVAVVVTLIAPIWMAVLVWMAGSILSVGVALWLFFFFIGRIAYVPQAMLIEGKGVLASVGRSFSLAKGNVRRLMAMTFFITFAFYSALMILVNPLILYGYLNGVNLSPLSTTEWPAVYAIGYSVLQSVSAILLAPIWMLGLSLLYVDERVRHEGYDIELMASRQLVRVPKMDVVSPYAPAIVLDSESVLPPPRSSGSVLGLS